MPQAVHLTSASVLEPLQRHMLGKLDAKSLGALACCSRLLNELVSEAGVRVWEAAVRQALPAGWHLPGPCTRASLQAALTRYTQSLSGIKAGWWDYTMHGSFPEPSFCASGRYLAAVVVSTIYISDAVTGEQVPINEFSRE